MGIRKKQVILLLLLTLGEWNLFGIDLKTLEFSSAEIKAILPANTPYKVGSFFETTDEKAIVMESPIFQGFQNHVPLELQFGRQGFSFKKIGATQFIGLVIFHVPGDNETVVRMTNNHFLDLTGIWADGSIPILRSLSNGEIKGDETKSCDYKISIRNSFYLVMYRKGAVGVVIKCFESNNYSSNEIINKLIDMIDKKLEDNIPTGSK